MLLRIRSACHAASPGRTRQTFGRGTLVGTADLAHSVITKPQPRGPPTV